MVVVSIAPAQDMRAKKTIKGGIETHLKSAAMHYVEPNDPSGYRASSKASIHNQSVILHVRAIAVADQIAPKYSAICIFDAFADAVVLRTHGARLCIFYSVTPNM
jgi:hypothetical protein